MHRTAMQGAALRAVLVCLAGLVPIVGPATGLRPQPNVRDLGARLPRLIPWNKRTWLGADRCLSILSTSAPLAWAIVDVHTGSVTPTPWLWANDCRWPVASPDGRRVLCSWRRPTGFVLSVWPVRGGHPHVWATDWRGKRYWLSDNRTIIVLGMGAGSFYRDAVLLDSDRVATIRKVRLPAIAAWSYGPPGVTRSDSLLGYRPPRKEDGRERFPMIEADARTGRLLHAWTVRIPRGQTTYHLAFSPRGDRIAWVFGAPGDPWRTNGAGLAPSSRVARLTVWVSGLRGNRMRPIGLLDVTRDSAFGSESETEWAPDGRHLLLDDRQNRCVWRIPVGR